MKAKTKTSEIRKGNNMYYASYTTNNGSTYNSKPYIYNNKREAIRSIREIARGKLSPATVAGCR